MDKAAMDVELCKWESRLGILGQSHWQLNSSAYQIASVASNFAHVLNILHFLHKMQNGSPQGPKTKAMVVTYPSPTPQSAAGRG